MNAKQLAHLRADRAADVRAYCRFIQREALRRAGKPLDWADMPDDELLEIGLGMLRICPDPDELLDAGPEGWARMTAAVAAEGAPS